jgi:hypothetical protein
LLNGVAAEAAAAAEEVFWHTADKKKIPWEMKAVGGSVPGVAARFSAGRRRQGHRRALGAQELLLLANVVIKRAYRAQELKLAAAPHPYFYG